MIDAAGGVDIESAGAAARHHAGRKPFRLQPRQQFAHAVHLRRRRRPCGRRGQGCAAYGRNKPGCPINRRCAAALIFRASAIAPSTLVTPVRPWPTSNSTMTERGLPDFWPAAASASTFSGIVRDHHQALGLLIQGDEPIDHRRRHDRRGDQHAFEFRRPRSPPPRRTVVQQMPMAPAAICRRPISIDLAPLLCGRRLMPAALVCAAMAAILRVERIEVEQQRRRIEAGARALLADESLVRPKAAWFRIRPSSSPRLDS